MKARRPGVGMAACLVTTLAAGGCNLDVLTDGLQAVAEQTQLVGASGNTLVLANATFADGAFDSVFTDPRAGSPAATFRVYSVDVATGETIITHAAVNEETLFGSAPDGDGSIHGRSGGIVGASGRLADGPWVAELSHDGGYIGVTDTASGVEARYLESVAADADLRLLGLKDDRLLVGVDRLRGGEALLVVIHLRTGDELVMDRVASFYRDGVAFDGARVAFAGIPDFDPGTQPLESSFAPATLDLVDLLTGQRQTLVSDVAAWGAFSVFFDGDRVVWMEATEEAFSVRAVDVATKAVELRDQFAVHDDGGYRIVYAANARVALLGQVVATDAPASILDLGSYAQTETITLRTFGGGEVTLLKYVSSGLPPVLSAVTLLTDDYAVVHDPATDELIVYSPATGETRRIPLLK